MSQPFVGGITIVAFGFAPRGYALCNGQILPINQNTALFSLLGTTYGGNGTTTFALPNLQGATPMHEGTSPSSGNTVVLGQFGGETAHTLGTAEMPLHTHQAQGSTATASAAAAAGNTWASSASSPYSGGSNASMGASTVQPAGANQPHDNLQPYLVINFVIALQGIFPSRD